MLIFNQSMRGMENHIRVISRRKGVVKSRKPVAFKTIAGEQTIFVDIRRGCSDGTPALPERKIVADFPLILSRRRK